MMACRSLGDMASYVDHEHGRLGREFTDDFAVRSVDARDCARDVVVERRDLRQVARERKTAHRSRCPRTAADDEEQDQPRAFREAVQRI